MTSSIVSRLNPTKSLGLGTRIALILAGTAALAIAAKVQVPFWPVPMTLQTLVVLLIGAGFGARMAGATLLAYLAEGALGLPVFASGAGLAYIAGPTGGFLLGFVLAAVFVGWAADRGLLRGIAGAAGIFLIAEALIFVPGLLWLAGFIGPEKALAAGLYPFVLGEAVKLVLAVLIAAAAGRRLGKSA